MREKGFISVGLLIIVVLISINTIIIANRDVTNSRFDTLDKVKLDRFTKEFENLKLASDTYYIDMMFYPPDVPEGMDPGFTHQFPWDPYTKKEDQNFANLKYAKELPVNWVKMVKKDWHGPYIKEKWPIVIPWGENTKIKFENWLGNTENRPNIVGITIINLPPPVRAKLLKLSEKGKFSFKLIPTNYHSDTDITMIVENND